MHYKKYKFSLPLLSILIITSIIIYKFIFYTPPLFDSEGRNIIERTIDFLCFGWHFTKASIYSNYLNNNKKAKKQLGKAGWYRERYLAAKYGVNEKDFSSILELYKNLDLNSIINKLYVYLIKKDHIEPSQLREAGESLIVFKNWKMATEVFSKVIYSNSNDVMIYYYLGLSHSKLKEFTKANQYFERVIELKPDFADAYFQLGIIAEKNKNWKKALSFYEKTINILPNHLECLKALTTLYKKSE